MNVNPNNPSDNPTSWWWLWIPKSMGWASVWWSTICNFNYFLNSIFDRKSRSLIGSTIVTKVNFREKDKLVNSFDSVNLNREGYWGCPACTTHNLNELIYCSVCSQFRGILEEKDKMPTELLSPGRPISILQNVAYALPVSRCTLFCDVAAATFTQSTTQAFTLSVALTPDANEGVEVSGAFIKLTSAGPVNIILKKT